MLSRTVSRLASSIALLFFLATGAALQAQEENVPTSVPELTPNADNTGLKVARTREDFTTISLAGSDLHADEPVSAGPADTKDFVRELVQVRWRANDPIDLYVILPRGVKNPPVVLYLYSFPFDTDRFRDDGWCRRVVSKGVAAVGFVSALTGQRWGHRPMQETFFSELQESLASTVHDVPMILNYLQKRGDVDMSRVGMFGQGSGGAIAILAAAAEPRIRTLDLLDPWGDWPEWVVESPDVPSGERSNLAKPEFLKRLEPLEPVRYLPDLKARIRLQFVDELPPMKSAKVIGDAAPKFAEIHHYRSSYELFSVSSGGRLFQWVSDQLKPTADAQSAAQSGLPETGTKSPSDNTKQ